MIIIIKSQIIKMRDNIKILMDIIQINKVIKIDIIDKITNEKQYLI